MRQRGGYVLALFLDERLRGLDVAARLLGRDDLAARTGNAGTHSGGALCLGKNLLRGGKVGLGLRERSLRLADGLLLRRPLALHAGLILDHPAFADLKTGDRVVKLLALGKQHVDEIDRVGLPVAHLLKERTAFLLIHAVQGVKRHGDLRTLRVVEILRPVHALGDRLGMGLPQDALLVGLRTHGFAPIGERPLRHRPCHADATADASGNGPDRGRADRVPQVL